MLPAFVKSSLRQIKDTLPRFLSILIITALGVAFFAGLRLTGPYMQQAGDNYLEQQQYADLKLVSTLGFDDADISAIKQTEGVKRLYAGYSLSALVETDDESFNIQLLSFDDGEEALNAPLLVDGRLPLRDGECLVEPEFLTSSGLQLGDVVTLIPGNDDDLTDSLNTVSYKITGTAHSPLYVGVERGTNDIGSGHIDAFFLIPSKEFKLEVFTEVYLTVDSSTDAFFTNEYISSLQPTADGLASTAEQRSSQRFDRLIAEGYQELTDAEQQIAEGYQELTDAQAELAQARIDLDTGWAELEDSAAQLAEGKASYERNLADFDARMASEQATLDDGYAQLSDGRKQYEAGLSEYQTGESSYQSGYLQYQTGLTEYEEGLAQYQQGEAELSAASDQLLLQKTEAFLLLDQQEAALDPSQPGYPEALAAIQQQRDDLTIQFDAAEAEIEAQKQQLLATKVVLDETKVQLDASKTQLDTSRAQLDQVKAQLDTSLQQLNDTQTQLDAGSAQLSAARQQGESQFATAWQEILDGQSAWEAGRLKLLDGETEYAEGLAEFLSEQPKALIDLSEAEAEISQGEQDLGTLEPPKWYVLNLEDNPGLFGFKSAAEQIKAIATIIPILFFLIAALVSMTSMTRLVDSDRTQIGTYKALGYRNGALFARYLFYALSASLVGGLIGVLVGYNVIPPLIFNAYSSMYVIPAIPVPFDIPYALLSVGVAVLTATVPALLVSQHIMHEMPAETMRPEAPKAGKHSLVEHIRPLWRRLSFLHKVTLRNLFRYKKRLFMTLLGVAGCTALMFAGFGLHDSLSTVSPKQYGEILHYDLQLDYRQDATADEQAELFRALDADGSLTEFTTLAQKPVEAVASSGNRNVLLISPQDPADIEKFISFKSADDGSAIPLDSEGVIITAGLARSLELQAGGQITLRDFDDNEAELTVAAVMENYVFNYVYVSPDLYAQGFGDQPEANQVLGILADGATTPSEQVLALEAVTGVTYMEETASDLGSMVGALKYVVWVLVVSAAALVFVVLFSLMTINLEERNRELASIKVLGFQDRELAAYVYREGTILTVAGIILGLALGVALERYIIATIEIDAFMFSYDLLWPSFLLSAVLTAVFAAIVNIIMYRGITRIEMVSSLKNVE